MSWNYENFFDGDDFTKIETVQKFLNITVNSYYYSDNFTIKKSSWKIGSGGIVDVQGNVDMSGLNLTEIPVKFGNVSHRFDCINNKLTTLKNCPDYCEIFNCSYNNLTTIDFIPNIKETFHFTNNKLSTFFKNIKEEDFPYWDYVEWDYVLSEYPFLITTCKNYVDVEWFKSLVKEYPKTKLYLR